MISDAQIHEFREIVWDYFRAHRRNMPWRDNPAPYHVLVSELMLQQTQVSRVVPKFIEFMHRFSSIDDLAKAPLAEVLDAWSGLGYNRRAKFLHAAAQQIVGMHKGVIPDDFENLVTLPGIGQNTAGAILAYAFNRPVVFIETNIRTVYFHHFFGDAEGVDDKDLLPLVEQTLDRDHPQQ
jgi:A/G-specific adenine glycosylase